MILTPLIQFFFKKMFQLEIYFIILIQLLLLAVELPNNYLQMTLFIWFISIIPYYKNFKYLNYMTGLASLLSAAYIIKQFNYTLSHETVSCLLVILTAIRLIEHKQNSQEKPYFIYLLGLFLSVAKFMFQIDLIYGLYAIMTFLYYFTLFLPQNFKSGSKAIHTKYIIKIFALSAPLTIILFLIFPRLNWKYTPRTSVSFFNSTGETGFSGELKPGLISKINDNYKIAFRAEIFSPQITKNDLYWRGQVLDKIMGLTWKKTNTKMNLIENIEFNKNTPPDYKIILESHQKNNIFSLENTQYVLAQERILYSEKNDTYVLSRLLDEQIIYNGYIVKASHSKNVDRQYYLTINNKNPKIENLILELDKKITSSSTSSSKVKLLEDFFKTNNFKYSTDLKNFESTSLVDFIFNTQVGFCEHYASASAILLRYWNIPTRVVVGYAGGEYNSAGQFWTVYEKDAHAWIEYLNEQDQWIRFDLTNIIAPDRANKTHRFLRSIFAQFTFLDIITSSFDFINYQWTLFFLEYTKLDYTHLLHFLTLNKDHILIYLYTIFLIIIFITLFHHYQKNAKFPTHKKAHKLFHYHFKKIHLDQYPSESLQQWKIRVQSALPSKINEIEFVWKIYLETTYGPKADPAQFKLLKHHLKKIK